MVRIFHSYFDEEGERYLLHEHTIYTEVDEQYITLFESYWDKYVDTLPPLPSILHDDMNQKAAVLNLWIGFSTFIQYKFLKCEKTFSHSFAYQLIQSLYKHLPDNHLLVRSPKAYDIHFLFAYYLAFEILHLLEEPLIQNDDLSAALPINYYSLTDADISPTADFYRLIKLYNVMIFNASSGERINRGIMKKATYALTAHPYVAQHAQAK